MHIPELSTVTRLWGGKGGKHLGFRLWLMQFVIVWYFVINQRVYTVQWKFSIFSLIFPAFACSKLWVSLKLPLRREKLALYKEKQWSLVIYKVVQRENNSQFTVNYRATHKHNVGVQTTLLIKIKPNKMWAHHGLRNLSNSSKHNFSVLFQVYLMH